MSLRLSELSSRDDLFEMFNELLLAGSGVEVGTHRADFARQICKRWHGSQLYCIDPWNNPPGYEEQAKTLWGNGDRQEDYQVARQVLYGEMGGRATMIRSTSEMAMPMFEDDSLDFVYLDGDHSQEAFAKDIQGWWPKLKFGGFMCGHDIVCPDHELGGWGRFIQPVTLAFAEEIRQDVWLIAEPNRQPWSFYIRRFE